MPAPSNRPRDEFMKQRRDSIKQILDALEERAKELNCLYAVDEILSDQKLPEEEAYRRLIAAIPAGWQYPEVCQSKITIGEVVVAPDSLRETAWHMAAGINLEGSKIGEVSVYYLEQKPDADEGPFLKEERRLINAIAERIGFFVMQRRLRAAHESLASVRAQASSSDTRAWQVLMEFLRNTDPALLKRITRKMINTLCWRGVREGEALLQRSLVTEDSFGDAPFDENRPQQRKLLQDLASLTDRTFELALEHLGEGETIRTVQQWINEEKSTFLIKSLENPGCGLTEMAQAIQQYEASAIDERELPKSVQTSLKVALLRRFFVDELLYINVAKEFVEGKDFCHLVQRLIYPPRSQGKLGVKGAGLFLASQVIQKSAEHAELLGDIRVPKTWYLVSDALLEFIHLNQLEEVYNRKYMEIERVRQDYPNIVHLFKNSRFPAEVSKGLAAALDDFDDSPLIVRSSSLLEDRVGAAFSGKYKSLFLANQGTKQRRLEALMDAIAEVYASVFGPDPIEYRSSRGYLDFREEMAVLIQEVVGQRIGRYFLPAFSGVAFSDNEYRWSARIRPDDGLMRLVPGLGTRAVDRLSDDYPVLVAPGQPQLRVNVTPDEIVRYSPRWIDVINLESNAFETVELRTLLKEIGDDYPLIRRLISIVDEDRIRKPFGLEPNWETDEVVFNFEGLLSDSPFMGKMRGLLKLLRDKIGRPIDIEFAHDENHLYLLQCRTQSRSKEYAPTPIPRNLPLDKTVFWAKRQISNGRVPDITHIVYVDPEAYANLSSLQDLKSVGRAVGRLNALLPKRQFILMGPGRWGSRGDVKLGVSVTYSDINNTAVLMEIARQKGNYLPELSFGTHFFQDLVEAEIRYIPLYPDEPGAVLDERFLRRSLSVSLGDRATSCRTCFPSMRDSPILCTSSTSRARPTGRSCGC
jgi:hypothetical protein